jgi:methyl-accepting chemotaxis protein
MVTKPTMKLSESLSRRQLMQLELLIASVVPAAAILVVAVAGTAVNFNYIFFTLDVLTCAVAVFIGERSIILRMQRAMDEQLIDLINACRGFIKGNKDLRVSMPGDDQLARLASTLNLLFDHQQTIANRPAKDSPSADEAKTHHADQTSKEIDLIHEQLEQLVDDISPALDGDLRVLSYVGEDTSDESIAMVADLCNALIVTLVDFIKWSFSGCDKMLKMSRKVLDRSIELANTTNKQMRHLSQMTAAVEKLGTSIQRIGSRLQLHVDMVEETYAHLQESKAVTQSQESYDILEQLTTNTQKQIQLLEKIIESIHNTTTIAESTIGGLYTFAQQFHQSGTAIIKTAENINAIVTTAEDWFKNAEQLSLPEEEE